MLTFNQNYLIFLNCENVIWLLPNCSHLDLCPGGHPPSPITPHPGLEVFCIIGFILLTRLFVLRWCFFAATCDTVTESLIHSQSISNVRPHTLKIPPVYVKHKCYLISKQAIGMKQSLSWLVTALFLIGSVILVRWLMNSGF